MHDFEYQIFVIRQPIFELPLFIIFLGSKTFFGILESHKHMNHFFNLKALLLHVHV